MLSPAHLQGAPAAWALRTSPRDGTFSTLWVSFSWELGQTVLSKPGPRGPTPSRHLDPVSGA